MIAERGAYERPTFTERLFNRAFGFLVRLGLGLPHNYLVVVRGRKSGMLFSNPVDVLDVGARRYLVAPRGRTQWVRNAEAAGELLLVRGRFRREYRVVPIPDSEKPPLLKQYLDRFATTVQRYFPVKTGSPESSFSTLADRYPTFELVAK